VGRRCARRPSPTPRAVADALGLPEAAVSPNAPPHVPAPHVPAPPYPYRREEPEEAASPTPQPPPHIVGQGSAEPAVAAAVAAEPAAAAAEPAEAAAEEPAEAAAEEPAEAAEAEASSKPTAP
jgi:hypothetical protein